VTFSEKLYLIFSQGHNKHFSVARYYLSKACRDTLYIVGSLFFIVSGRTTTKGPTQTGPGDRSSCSHFVSPLEIGSAYHNNWWDTL
jgi:hypothetical protein